MQAHGLKTDGSKIELYKVVEAYFSGEKILPERKAAAALWKIVRDSDMKKEYSHELFEKYKNVIF